MKEFERWIEQKTFYDKNTELRIAAAFAWKAALEWIKYEGVLSDIELAGTLIDEELNGE